MSSSPGKGGPAKDARLSVNDACCYTGLNHVLAKTRLERCVSNCPVPVAQAACHASPGLPAPMVTRMAVLKAHLGRFTFHALALLGLSLFIVLLYRRDFGTGVLQDSLSFSLGSPPQPPLPLPISTTRTPCSGPRGRSVQDDRDDQVLAQFLDLRTSLSSPRVNVPSWLGMVD